MFAYFISTRYACLLHQHIVVLVY